MMTTIPLRLSSMTWVPMAALALTWLLSGCASEAPTTNGYPAYDLWHNRYPPQCQRDLNGVNVPIEFVSRAQLAAVANQMVQPARGRELLAWYRYSPPRIFVYNGLKGRELVEAIRHEKCHHLAGEWHS